MAIRNIRVDGDDVLRKKAREVDELNERIMLLIKDMSETMYDASGIGLAAPQVGVLKRIIVVDPGDGLMELINPVIIESSGEQFEIEGCLSIPGIFAEVRRPLKLKLQALRATGENVLIDCEDNLARVVSHEVDHLDGILFKDKAIRYVDSKEMDRINKKKRAEARRSKDK